MAEEAFAEGIAGIERPDNIEKYLEDRMWVPASQSPLCICASKLQSRTCVKAQHAQPPAVAWYSLALDDCT